MNKNTMQVVECEVVKLLHRADLKKLLSTDANSMERSTYLIMKKLKEENILSISMIAQDFQVNVSTISRQVQALKQKEWVEVVPNLNDARVQFIHLTNLGHKMILEAQEKRVEAYNQILFHWTEKEI
ncbi:MarR family winged helix-turn-helix transcriptional regulator, partial [Bacillus cereus]